VFENLLFNKAVIDVKQENLCGEYAEDYKKMVRWFLQSGGMYKVIVEGALWKPCGDDFFLYAASTEREAIQDAYEFARFGKYCCAREGVPDYVLPFRLYNVQERERLVRHSVYSNKVVSQLVYSESFVYRHVPKTPMPNWNVYKLTTPVYLDDWVCFYSKNNQTAIAEARVEVERFLFTSNEKFLKNVSDAWNKTSKEFFPLPYQVLCNDEIIYDYVPPYSMGSEIIS
jgi:hypothetical protein